MKNEERIMKIQRKDWKRKATLLALALPWPMMLPSSMVSVHCSTACAQQLTVTTPTMDCGTTGYETPVTATFELWNKGQHPLVISDVRADCGCTKVEYPKGEIEVGAPFKVTMTYDARQLGHYYKQCAISSNGSEAPVYLTMKGVILADMHDYSGSYPFAMGDLLLDKNYLEFDDVNRGDQPMQEIYIMNNGKQMMQPSVMHLPSYLSAVIEPKRLSPGHSGKVTLTLLTDKVRQLGLTQTSVYMGKVLGERVSQQNELPVSVVLLPDLKSLTGKLKQQAPKLELSADKLELGTLDAKSKKSGELVLTNMGHSTLKVSSLQMFTPGLKVTLGKRELAPGQSTKLKVTAYGDKLKTARSMPRILMITNDPNHAKVVIEVHAN